MILPELICIFAGLNLGFLVVIALKLDRLEDQLKRIEKSIRESAPDKPCKSELKYHSFYGHRIYHD